ncbi:MAG: CAP domain-containing protein, partial [Flavobacteriales bacterium]
LLLCIPFIGFSQVRLHDWDNNFYNKYNSSSFQSLEIVHQLIDHNNIDYELLNAAIFYSTNIQRVKNGRNTFIHSYSLEKASQSHSKDMAIYDFFSHTSSVRGKRSMSDRLALVGIQNCYMAENIALRSVSSSYWDLSLSLLDQWMNSSGHRKNLLNSNYHYLGCGSYAYLNGGYTYIKSTQNFSSIVGTREITNNTTTKKTTTKKTTTKNTINKKEINENTLQENISYGNQMFVCDPVLLFSGSINVGYERFSNNNLLSYKFPLKIKYKNYRNNKNND